MDSVSVPSAKPKFALLNKFLSKPYGVGLVSVIGVAVLSGVVSLFFTIMNNGESDFTFIFAMLATVLSYALVILVPAISFGFSRGWKAGISVIAYEAFWMALIVLAVSYLFPSPDIMY